MSKGQGSPEFLALPLKPLSKLPAICLALGNERKLNRDRCHSGR
jgi:hypothetical protein